MKLTYTTQNNRLNVEIETESVKDGFKKLAEFQEVFDEKNCGMCNSEALRFMVRTVESNDYFELRCNSCSAKLVFGQNKVGGGLFPKRKRSDGSFDREHKGWHKWSPEQKN